MSESFKLQIKSKRSDLVRQALSRTGLDLRKAMLWSVTILALTGAGIGVTYWMGRRAGNPPPAVPPEVTPQPAPSNPAAAVPPEPVVKEEAPSVAAPYFTEKMNKEVDNLRVEGIKTAFEQQYMRKLSDMTANDLTKKPGKVSLRSADRIITDRKELSRIAVKENVADPDTAREYALENEIRYSIRSLLEEPSQPEEPPAPYPPIPQEPSFIEELWKDFTSSIRDILRYFL